MRILVNALMEKPQVETIRRKLTDSWGKIFKDKESFKVGRSASSRGISKQASSKRTSGIASEAFVERFPDAQYYGLTRPR